MAMFMYMYMYMYIYMYMCMQVQHGGVNVVYIRSSAGNGCCFRPAVLQLRPAATAHRLVT